MKVFLSPNFRGPDKADGGVRRVIEAAHRWLPTFGVELVDSVEEAELVHTHITGVQNVPVDKPYLLSIHGLYWAEYDWPAWAYKLNGQVVDAMRHADHVSVPSEWVAQVVRRGMWMNPTVLPHGVNPEEWEGGTNEGYILFNKARQDVYSDPTPVNELAIRDQSLRFVSTFGETMPNVRITGAMPYPEMREVIKNAGVYLCTVRETLGIGTLEAMAAGVPVVGWAWGGQRDIIEHGVTGWLAAPGDYDGLLDGIRWAQANRRKVGADARWDVLQRWTWEQAVGRYAALYQSMIAGHAAKRQGPKVSVIVPCYNLGRFVGETLASVQDQTFDDWECIVVDDASTDDSAAVIRGFGATDPRITFLRNERNQHVSETRNRGIAASKGQYVICLDADDRMTPDTLGILAGALDKDRGIHLAYGGLQIMSEAGVLRDSPHEWPVPFDFKEQIQGRNQIPTLCMMRREVWERTGGYRRRVSPVEDADLWTRAASIGFVPQMVTDAPTLLYRLRADSISRTMPNPQWVDWYPWSRSRALVPFGAAVDPPEKMGAWPVPTHEPSKVAVIIPVGRGHERLLIDALDSVEAQTFRQWECIVVNDTGAPLPFVPPWAKVLATDKPGSGPAAARNIGIRASTAALFVPLDADDYLQPHALQTLLEVWGETGGVVYSAWWDDFGKESNVDSKVYHPPAYDARLLTAKGCIHAVTALYPKAAWAEVGGFDEKMSHWEDWDFQLALAAKGVCGHMVDEPLWTYRKHTGERRENNQRLFEQGKHAILKKWGRFWDGREVLMACRGCGQGSVSKKGSGGGAGLAGMGDAPGGAVLLEFQGPSPSTVTYRGKGTGTSYRFGNTDNDRRKYVLAADAPYLVSLRTFRVIESAAVPVAAGPSPVLTTVGPVDVAPLPEVVEVAESVTEIASGGDSPILSMSWKEVRDKVGAMGPAELREAIAAETGAENPRSSVVKLLERALETQAVPA